jgi:hypothetical protein
MRTHAVCLVWIGWTIAATAGIGALVFGFATGLRALELAFVMAGIPDRSAVVLAGMLIFAGAAVLGTAVGTPFIVAGELVLIALDQRRILLRHARALRRMRADQAVPVDSIRAPGIEPSPALRRLIAR